MFLQMTSIYREKYYIEKLYDVRILRTSEWMKMSNFLHYFLRILIISLCKKSGFVNKKNLGYFFYLIYNISIVLH